jgi:hypothetical protein
MKGAVMLLRKLLIVALISAFVGCTEPPQIQSDCPPCPSFESKSPVASTEVDGRKTVTAQPGQTIEQIRVGLIDVQRINREADAVARIKNKINDYPDAKEYGDLIRSGVDSEQRKKLEKRFTSRAVSLQNTATDLIRRTVQQITNYPAIFDKVGTVWYCPSPEKFFKQAIEKGIPVQYVPEDVTDKVIQLLK